MIARRTSSLGCVSFISEYRARAADALVHRLGCERLGFDVGLIGDSFLAQEARSSEKIASHVDGCRRNQEPNVADRINEERVRADDAAIGN